MLLLFTPILAPAQECEWEEIKEQSNECARQRSNAWATWNTTRESIQHTTEDEYAATKAELLDSLTSSGNLLALSLRRLEKSYHPDEGSVDATASEGVRLRYEDLAHHIYVSEEVMKELDDIYIQHYRPNGAPGNQKLIDYFNMMQDRTEKAQANFKNYLSDIKEKLADLSSTPQAKLSLAVGDPQTFGLREAASKLDPLFWPLEHRVALPLPTVSMLEDLKICLSVDEGVITEVRFLASHLQNDI